MEIDPEAPAHASTLRIRVRFCETDLMGIVHHAAYLTYFEAARVAWLRRRGITYADWARGGLHLPVVEARTRYRAPARFDELIDIETRIAELSSYAVTFSYRMRRGATLLATGTTKLACVDDRHQLVRMNAEMRRVLLGPEVGGSGGAVEAESEEASQDELVAADEGRG